MTQLVEYILRSREGAKMSFNDSEKPEAYFAAMAFMLQYQTTADDQFIFDATRWIMQLWVGAKMERKKTAECDQRPPPRILRLVGE